MPQIINPYANQKTMGDDLFGLGSVTEAFFGPKASTSAYAREKFKEQQRQNLGVEELAALMRTPGSDPGAMAAASILGNVDYKNLGGANLFAVAGRNPDPMDPRVVTAQTQAQVPFGQTATGFNANLDKSYTIAQMQANKVFDAELAKAANTPYGVINPVDPTQTMTVSAGEAIKNRWSPIPTAVQTEGTLRAAGFPSAYAGWNTPQQRAAGVAPTAASVGTDKNYAIIDRTTGEPVDRVVSRDGVTHSNTGLPIKFNPDTQFMQVIGPDNPAVLSGMAPSADPIKQIQESQISTKNTLDGIKELRTAVKAPGSGAALGMIGQGAQALNSLRAQVDALTGTAKDLGYTSLASSLDAGSNSIINRMEATPGFMAKLQAIGLDRARMKSMIISLGYARARLNHGSGTLDRAVVQESMEEIGAAMADPKLFDAVLGDVEAKVVSQHKTKISVLARGLNEAQRRRYLPDEAPAATTAPAGTTAAPVDREAVDNALKLYGGTP